MPDRFGLETFSINKKVKMLRRMDKIKTKRIEVSDITLDKVGVYYSIKPQPNEKLYTEIDSIKKTMEYIWKEFFDLGDAYPFKYKEHFPSIFKNYLITKLKITFDKNSTDDDVTNFVILARNGLFDKVIYDIPPQLMSAGTWVAEGIVKIKTITGLKLKKNKKI